MGRKDFISDNLVNIRDRLKQNYREPAAGETEETVETAESASVSVASAPVSPPPPAPEGVRSAETGRFRRELAGRFQHDLSWAATELEQFERRRRAFEAFVRGTEKRLKLLENAAERPATEAEYLAHLERLHLEHEFQRGSLGETESIPVAEEERETPRRKLEDLMYEALPLFLALLIAALVVSGALALIFM